MKKFLLLLCASLLGTWAIAAANPNFQDNLAEELKSESGVILVRNDTIQPLEINEKQTGKHLLCLTGDFKKFFLYKVVKETFVNGHTTALVRCNDGRIYVGGGYL